MFFVNYLTRANLLIVLSVLLLLIPMIKKIQLPENISNMINNQYMKLLIPLLILFISKLYYDIAIFVGVLYIVLMILSTKKEIIKTTEGFYNDKIKIIENITEEDDEELTINELE